LLALYFFTIKYIPLIRNFLLVLVPVLLVVLVATLKNIRWGILAFVFVFPLINNLPYFFGIDTSIPHAPTALVLFLVFFLGCLVRKTFDHTPLRLDHPLFKPILLFSVIVLVSGILTFFRFSNVFPFLARDIRELMVNVNQVRTGGAVMSILFVFLNYLTGFLFFFILYNTVKSMTFVKKILFTLACALSVSLVFSLVQKYHSIDLGNTPFWVAFHQINSTFKDPNSFGIYIAVFLPLALGMFFSDSRLIKIFALLLIVLSLFVFPSIGSRSAFLGLLAAVVTFFVFSLVGFKAGPKKKILSVSAFFLILAVLLFSYVAFSRSSKLYRRIGWSFEALMVRGSYHELFTQKLNFWKAASHMVRDYPLTGVGLGSFIVELPNYSKRIGLPFEHTDSAENYFFQVGSELGLIGFFISLWLFFLVLKQMRRSWNKHEGSDKQKYMLIGIFSGIFVFFVNFFFHSYIGSFEVKYLFWLLIALLVFFGKKQEAPDHKLLNARFWAAGAILAVLFAVVHGWNSVRTLSVNHFTQEFDIEQNFGLHGSETDNRGFVFRWTKKTAGTAVKGLGETLVIPVMASHPDVKQNPVEVKVFLGDRYFNKKVLQKVLSLSDHSWVNVTCPVTQVKSEDIHLVFETSRVWQPLKHSGIPDPRWLGIGLGELWFKYPADFVGEKIVKRKIVSSAKWKGKYQENLWGNGESKIEFRTDQKGAVIRLHLRGQRAFGVGPLIVVRVDDRLAAKTMIDAEEWTALVLIPEISAGRHVLGVEFCNDIGRRDLEEDRNVFLGDLEILYRKQRP
jgi:O-antigen ligase